MLKYLYLGRDIPPLPVYNLFLGIGMIAFFLSLEKVIRKNAISLQTADEIKSITLICAGFGILGAAIAEAMYHRTGINIEFSGFTFYGGLIASLFSLWVLSRLKGISFIFSANVLTQPLVLAHAFGRIGCFLGGCCYGIPTTSIFGVVFPEDSLPYLEFGVQPIHPTQLYESFFLFLLYLFLTRIELKWKFVTYLIAYPIIRFIIECFRGDSRGALIANWLSPSQEISVLLFFIGTALLSNLIKRRTNASLPIAR